MSIPWSVLPQLGSKQHFYPPNVKYVETQPSHPLNYENIQKKLEHEYDKFITLLEKRKKSFEESQPFLDSESEISTSSSDSDQEFEIDKILEKKVDRENITWYLVTWKYYPGESTWIKRSGMDNATDLIKEFERNNIPAEQGF